MSGSKKILVLVADYPSEKGVALMYVHTRNKAYSIAGHEVVVLNFNAEADYIYEGMRVITLKTYQAEYAVYDILLLHAANIRNHYLFLKKYAKQFRRLIFFYHGHEVLRINTAYPKPYVYVKKNKLQDVFQELYDTLKLCIWRKYLPKVKDKSDYVFVSKWMEEEFFKNTKIDRKMLEGKCHITYNSVGKAFENARYNSNCKKEYDFITIRSYMDGSKYCIDLVNSWAKNTPEAKFLVVGRGDYFKHDPKAKNIFWLDKTMNHEEMLSYLDRSKFALMPTRTDAQGLMMCEMAAYGIPVITSDISVCHEVFDGFENVTYVDNNPYTSLIDFLHREYVCQKDERYFLKNTVQRELELFEEGK